MVLLFSVIPNKCLSVLIIVSAFFIDIKIPERAEENKQSGQFNSVFWKVAS